MRNKLIIFTLALGVVFSICLSIVNFYSNQKVVFVNSLVVVEQYVGMKEVQRLIDARSKSLTARLDSLYRASFSVGLEGEDKKVNSSQQNDVIAKSKIQNYYKLKEQEETAAKEEGDKLLQGALNQINSYIEEYSKKNDIDIVVGVTVSGSLLYGSERVDITNDIVEGLNKRYK